MLNISYLKMVKINILKFIQDGKIDGFSEGLIKEFCIP